MTTPKQPTLAMRMAIHSDAQRPFRELAEEFRRLAAEAVENREKFRETQESYLVTFYNGMRVAYQRAAQMLEEKLNG